MTISVCFRTKLWIFSLIGDLLFFITRSQMCFPGNFWPKCTSLIKSFSIGMLSGVKYAHQLQRNMQMWTWGKQGSKMLIYFLFSSAGQCELQPLNVLLEHFSFCVCVFTLLVTCNIRSHARLQILTFGCTNEFSKKLPKPKTDKLRLLS